VGGGVGDFKAIELIFQAMNLFSQIRLLFCGLLVCSILFLSCGQHSKSSETVGLLPNGKRLLDTYDSAMSLYYKEVVGSDTLLDGGITCYGEDDSMRYFYLRKGNLMHQLNQSSLYQSPWSLGILEEEFPEFFLVRIDNGNSSPVSYQVFNKKDGTNRMGEGRMAISLAYWKDSLFLLRYNQANAGRRDSLILFNAYSKREEVFPLPESLPEACEIHIIGIDRHSIRFSYESIYGESFEMEKKYRRLAN
jgi:hypothetical protein